MGMYDEVFVHADVYLPDFPPSQDRIFQTKDFECMLDKYAISDTGRLTKEECFSEDVPEAERPYYTDPEFHKNPLLKFAGSIKRVVTGIVDMEFDGTVTFYTLIDGITWLEYKAIFVMGNLIDIKKV